MFYRITNFFVDNGAKMFVHRSLEKTQSTSTRPQLKLIFNLAASDEGSKEYPVARHQTRARLFRCRRAWKFIQTHFPRAYRNRQFHVRRQSGQLFVQFFTFSLFSFKETTQPCLAPVKSQFPASTEDMSRDLTMKFYPVHSRQKHSNA